MGAKPRGTVTPLSESISVQDAENVAKKVAEAVESQMQQLRTLQGFADENKSLTKLLLELPDLVSYNVMVPFGKAAFMPGRLIHTNEFLVLLGEGYYAERSAKQAAEILTRRSNFITTKMEALEEQIKDLEVEASFAKETAAEAAGGLVEIREEYTGPSLQPALETTMSTNDTATTTIMQDDKEMDTDNEHARIMARLTELEMAEEAADVEDEDEDEEEYEDSEGTQNDFRAIFRESRLVDSDETEEGDEDEEEEEEEEEGEEEDEGSEELDLGDTATANTFLNRSAVRLPEIEEQDPRQRFQSIISQGQVQTRDPESQRLNFPAAGPSEPRRVKFSNVDDTSNPSSTEPLPPRNIKSSDAQKRAFTGSVVERNTELLPPPPAAPETPSNRPVSKFRQRKG